MTSSQITVTGLTKRFGSTTAVDDVSFDIERGEFVSILGPSGSGKSTILRMIGGFEQPTAGSITIDGEEVAGQPPFKRDVNMVFQNLALFPHLTVAENIAFGLKQSDRSLSKSEIDDRIESVLEMVQLGGYGDRDPGELSGGEQQRVAVARAVVNEPELLLLDEPLSSLDRKLRQRMQTELQHIQMETGITFLYVTHDQEVAMSISDKLVLLNDGQIEQQGTVEELYEQPSTPFVADFIGDSNVLEVGVDRITETEVVLQLNGHSVTCPIESLAGGDVETASKLVACVRPHSIELSATRPSAANGTFTIDGVVRNRSYSGNTYTYRVGTSVGELRIDDVSEKFATGDEVSLSWPAADVHLYPDAGPVAAAGSDGDAGSIGETTSESGVESVDAGVGNGNV